MAPDTAPEIQPGERPRPRQLTARERRGRVILLVVLLALLALLAYATYYFTQNRRLPMVRVSAPAEAIEPPQYLYSITGARGNKLLSPVGVAVAPDGRVFVVDFGRRRISAFTNRGRFLYAFNKTDKVEKTDKGVLVNPVHLALLNNELWVTDRRQKAIFIYALDGTFKRRFKPLNEDLAWGPLAIAFSRAGELRATDVGSALDHRLVYFSKEGSRTATVGETVQVTVLDDSPGGFYFPNGIAVARDGKVFVSDGDNRRVQVFGDKGEFVQFVDTSGVPRGVAIDSEQRLYVVDAVAHTVDIYSLKGEPLTKFGSQGFGPGQFNFPNDVALDARGRVYVSDRSNGQVQVWGWPVAQPPAIVAPTSPWGWLLCLAPLFLLPLLLLFRKIRFVVTPDFIEALIAAEKIKAVSERRRIRLIAPEEDRPLYEGRSAEDVDLGQLIEFEEHSESDARALMEKLEIEEREAVLLSMAGRVRALATEDRDLRRLAALAEVRSISLEAFLDEYLQESRS